MTDTPADATATPLLSPAQEATLAALRPPREGRRTWEPGMRAELALEIDAALGDVLDDLEPDRPMVLTKHRLTQLHGCLRAADDDAPFEWSPQRACGTVAHKAIELLAHGADLPPGDLVDRALTSVAAAEFGLGPWLADADPLEVAEVRALAVERVTTFEECFPPLPSRWRPVTESRLRADLVGGRLSLRGRADLTLGRPDGTVAGKVIVDLKTGRPNPAHLDDLRFYALVEALRLGVPPLRMASYYLESATAQVEDVTPATLETAMHRVIDGVAKARSIESLASAARPAAPGPRCRWCTLRPTCPEGSAWETADDAW